MWRGMSIFSRVITVCVFLFSAIFAMASPEQRALTAAELVGVYRGEPPSSFDSFFSSEEDRQIVQVEIHAVGIHETTARYSGREHPWYEVNNILRITTADGYEGVSGVDAYYKDGFSDALLVELKGAAEALLQLGALDPVVVARLLGEKYPGLSDAARASIDIAMWDLAARRAGLPLHKLLGSSRNSIAAYASLPFYETLPEYLAAVAEYAAAGYSTFKFHTWGDIERDLQLVRKVQERFAETGYRFMVDLESVYSLEEAQRLGEQMDRGLFIWFEAPVDDRSLASYAELRRNLDLSIIPAGYNVYSQDFIREGIAQQAWDAARFDATVVGGITRALQLLMIADAAGMPVEFQSWGYSFTQVVNLHLMLANDRTEFFEAPMPSTPFEFGMNNGVLFQGGSAMPPAGAGLGIDVNWDGLAGADFHRKAVVSSARRGGKES